jgi:integrase
MEVRPHYREGRRRPWEARWYVNRKPRSKFFEAKKDRDRFIKEFQREIGRNGEEVYKVDGRRQREWQEVDSILPHVSPLELARCWLQHQGDGKDRTFSEAMQAYLLEMKRAGRDADYQKHTLRALKRFAASHGENGVGAITSEEVSEFIHGLPFQALTKRHYRTYLVGAFKWFLKQGWVENNPAAAVPSPKVDLQEPGILTVEETEALFRANEKVDPEICGLLALGAFAGMRTSAINRLAYEDIEFSNRAILIPAAKAKKGRRHYIEGLPDNLWSWLERTPAAAFQMNQRQFAYRRAAAFVRAGLLVSREKARRTGAKPKSPPKNCLRHSFVSYHVALHRDPGKTALLVSHKDQAILWDHYLGVATGEDAGRYFSITP